MSRQLSCRDVCKIVNWIKWYYHNQTNNHFYNISGFSAHKYLVKMGSRFGRHLGIVISLEKVWQVDLVAMHLFQLWSRSPLLTSQLYNNNILLYSRRIRFSCTHTTIATPSHNTYAPTNLDQLRDDTRTTFKCCDIFVNVFSEKLMRNVYSSFLTAIGLSRSAHIHGTCGGSSLLIHGLT